MSVQLPIHLQLSNTIMVHSTGPGAQTQTLVTLAGHKSADISLDHPRSVDGAFTVCDDVTQGFVGNAFRSSCRGS